MAGESTDELVVRIDERVGALLNHVGDLEDRMRNVEKWQPRLAAASIVVAALLAIDVLVRFFMG